MGNNPSRFINSSNPVERVSWNDCQEFIAKLNAKTDTKAGKYTLPTEAQWEYACRAGSENKFCFGGDKPGLLTYGWHVKNSESVAHPVGEKKPNAWGFYDMHGNVAEWCQDWHQPDYYEKSPTEDPVGPAAGKVRVVRGGFWGASAWRSRSAYRDHNSPGRYGRHLGLRLCLVQLESWPTKKGPPPSYSPVPPCQSLVWKGDAGRPSLLTRLGYASFDQPKRALTGTGTSLD